MHNLNRNYNNPKLSLDSDYDEDIEENEDFENTINVLSDSEEEI